jgi:hypothetical protein
MPAFEIKITSPVVLARAKDIEAQLEHDFAQAKALGQECADTEERLAAIQTLIDVYSERQTGSDAAAIGTAPGLDQSDWLNQPEKTATSAGQSDAPALPATTGREPDERRSVYRSPDIDNLITQLTLVAAGIAKLADALDSGRAANFANSQQFTSQPEVEDPRSFANRFPSGAAPITPSGREDGIEHFAAAPQSFETGDGLAGNGAESDSRSAPRRLIQAAAPFSPDLPGAFNPAPAADLAIQSIDRLTGAFLEAFEKIADHIDKSIATLEQRINNHRWQ